ncbi:MAG: hypothetical protein PVI11_08970 [Candidatus Aminicenantes bacterium]
MEFFVFVKLLNQQYTSPSTVGEKVYEDHLAFIFGLGKGVIQGALHKLSLSGGKGGENEKE